MNYNRTAIIMYAIILLIWTVLIVIPLAIGVYDDLSKLLRNKLKTLSDGQTAKNLKSIFREIRTRRGSEENSSSTSV